MLLGRGFGYHRIALLCTAGAFVGCDDTQSVNALEAKIGVTPASLELGEIPLGATKRAHVTLTNHGSLPLEIAELGLDAPFVTGVDGGTIAPGGELVVDLAFHPELLGWAEGQLAITSNGGDAAVKITATTVDGLVAGHPPVVELMDVTLDTTRTGAFIIANYDEVPVTGKLIAEGFTNPAHFRGGPLPAGEAVPVTLDARANQEIELSYTPIVEGADSGRIMFEFCGERCGVEIAVRASGTAAALKVDPSSVDFGEVDLGRRAFARAALANHGAQPIEVFEIAVDGAIDVLVRPTQPLPITLAAGARVDVDLEYVAGAPSREQGHLVVRSTDGGQPELRAPMSGVGRGSEIQVTPEALNYGVVARTDRVRRGFQVVNAGRQMFTITAVELDGSAAFELAEIPGLPFRVSSGDSLSGALFYTPNAPGEYEATITIRTDRAGEAPYVIPVTAGYADDVCQLDLSPRRVSFGVVPTLYAVDQEVTITNSGDERCTLLGAQFETGASPDFVVDAPTWPLVLDPGQQHSLRTTYTPSVQSIAKATYVLRTDDTLFAEHPLQLVGNANIDPTVFAEPPALDFGGPQCGASTQRRTFIYNTGTQRVVVERMEVDNQAFTVSADATPPFALDAGSSVELTVTHATGPQTLTAVMRVHIRGRTDALNIPLRVRDQISSDSFRQTSPRDIPPVDVLFAISNNCIMPTYQQRLVDAFDEFVQAAQASGNDYRIGVTSTRVGGPNAGEDGRLRGAVLNRTTQDINGEFRRQALMGGIGGHFEEGLNVVVQALERSERREAPNVDLFRPGTKRVFVIISNEGDYSPLEPAFYANELRRREGNGVSNEIVMLLAGTERSCRNTNPTPNYPEFANLTGAEVQSICQNDWDVGLSTLGDATFGLRTRFRLSARAEGNIEIRVDGVQILGGWRLDSAGRTIAFDRGFEPPAGSAIEISYATGC